jgi:hypothetical protein
MSVFIQPGFYGTDWPLSHPRIGWRAIAGTITASSAGAGFGANLAALPATYNGWKPASLPATWEVDAGSAQVVSYCGIGAHTLGTNAVTVAVQYFNGTSWVTVVSGLPDDDTAALFLFSEISAQRWRISLTGSGAMPRLGNIRFGRVLEMPRLSRFAPSLPITEAQQYRYNVNISDGGEWLGRSLISQGLSFSIDVEHVSEEFAETEWREFRDHCNTGGATFFAAPKPFSYPKEVAYAWSSNTVRADRQFPKREISRSFTLDCMGYSKP